MYKKILKSISHSFKYVTSEMSEDDSNFCNNYPVKWNNPITFTLIVDCNDYFLLYFMKQTDKK